MFDRALKEPLLQNIQTFQKKPKLCVVNIIDCYLNVSEEWRKIGEQSQLLIRAAHPHLEVKKSKQLVGSNMPFQLPVQISSLSWLIQFVQRQCWSNKFTWQDRYKDVPETCQRSKMGHFAKNANGFQPNIFLQNAPSQMFDKVLNTPLPTN